MIQIVPTQTGLPEETATQVSIDVMTFNTEAPQVNTYYKVCNVDGKALQTGNYKIDVIVMHHSFSDTITEIEDAVLNYLSLTRIVV